MYPSITNEPPLVASEVLPRPLQVLMVEDNPADAELCLRELKKAGYDARVKVVQTAQEFAKGLSEGGYHIVLGDYSLPAWSGLEALEMLQQMEKDLPFILVTGTMREEDAVRCAQKGAVDYVHKDSLGRVALAVRLALERKALREEHLRLAEKCRSLEEQLNKLTAERGSVSRQEVQPTTSPEEALSNSSLASFAAFHPDPVLEFSPDGQLTCCNEAARQMAESLGAVHPRAVLPPETPAIVLTCLTTGQKKLRVETSVGSRTFSWSFYPIQQQQVVLCQVSDITDRQQLEAQLRHSQKLESVGRLASGIAHDFNNVLTVIQGHTGLLRSEASALPVWNESVQQIARAAENGRTLTGQLLAFSRRNVLQPQELDLNEVLASLSSLLHRTLGEDINFQFSYASELPTIHGDRGLIEQVIMNLAVNARDAMPRGGQLVIHTAAIEVEPASAERHPSEARPGRFISLTVADTGCGMDTVTQSRIFEPFFTTKEFGKGTGLGLATVYGIVKQHQGWIEVQSQMGQGTTFKIFLPPGHRPIQKTAGMIAEREVAHGTETILVVEDEPPVRWIVKDVLTKHGYKVLEAGNGVEALALWHQHHSEIALLLTDVVMPVGLSGQELAENFSGQKPSLKVMFISGYSLQAAGKGFSTMEGLNFLQKPFDGACLATAVRHCLDS